MKSAAEASFAEKLCEHAALEIKNNLMIKKVQSFEKLEIVNKELEIANGMMNKKVESYEKLKAMIKESDILSE